MSGKTMLYENIINDILEDVKSGKLKDGDKIPTDAELCDIYNVSRITVTRALKELEYRGMLIRIKKKGTFIKLTEQPVSKDEEPGSIPAIAVVLPFGEEYGFDILQGVESICARGGYYVTFHNSKFKSENEKAILERVFSDRLLGAIVYPCDGYRNIEIYSKLIIHRFPFVFIDRSVEGLNVPHVVSDNIRAGYDITNHLLELGHTRIAFVCTDLNEAASVSDRYKGYCNALIGSGIAPKPEWLIEDHADIEKINHEDKEVRLQVNLMRLQRILALEDGPTAVVAVNDETAIQLMEAAKRLGVKVPEQLSVTGFDNLQAGAGYEVPLTTIRQKFNDLGASAAEVVLTLLEDGSKSGRDMPNIVLDTELVIRNSAAAPQA
ncbi:GntR family transcriptional regulator [Cohnella fermenti]|nr:GntR family transcriptional regulator [Cohnella fermenti]